MNNLKVVPNRLVYLEKSIETLLPVDEIIKNTQNYYSSFGIFVGLYNKLNGTFWSVKDAFANTEIKNDFMNVSMFLKSDPEFKETIPTEFREYKQTSTKSKSFFNLNKRGAAWKIYTTLVASDNALSRQDIADASGMALCTVTGQIPRLIRGNYIRVSGKRDGPHNQIVEIIEVVNKERVI